MKPTKPVAAFIFALPFVIGVFGQQPVVINDPTVPEKESTISDADKALIDRDVWPVISKKFEGEVCTPEFEYSDAIQGSFTKPKAQQRLIFFQVCETGNGIGVAGLALIEDGKVVRIYGAEQAGWVGGARTLPDINLNGVDEVSLYWSGGLHQGEGGVGVDVMELLGSAPRGIGWFQSESFSADGDTVGYKVSVKKAKVPVFSRQKYVLDDNDKWRLSGRPAVFKPEKNVVEFAAIR
jgi:hypothetical protein